MEIFGISQTSNWYAYLILPMFIFLARVCDVSLGTIRIIMISRGNRAVSAILGFIEVIIWLLAVTQVLNNLTNIASYLGYGAGFAAGNYLGITLENRLAMGTQAVRIITEDSMKTLSMILRGEGFGVTNLQASGHNGEMEFIFVVTPRKRMNEMLSIVNKFNPNAFISISDVRTSQAGYFGARTNNSRWPWAAVKKK